LATPNYGFEKRQRELAKKKKKEEKLRAKAAGKRLDGSEAPEGDAADDLGPEGERPSGSEGTGNPA